MLLTMPQLFSFRGAQIQHKAYRSWDWDKL